MVAVTDAAMTAACGSFSFCAAVADGEMAAADAAMVVETAADADFISHLFQDPKGGVHQNARPLFYNFFRLHFRILSYLPRAFFLSRLFLLFHLFLLHQISDSFFQHTIFIKLID